MRYFIAEENKLAEDGKGFEVLCECPSEVTYEGAIEGGMEEEGKNYGDCNEVVRFYSVEILTVTAFEGDYDGVEDVS